MQVWFLPEDQGRLHTTRDAPENRIQQTVTVVTWFGGARAVGNSWCSGMSSMRESASRLGAAVPDGSRNSLNTVSPTADLYTHLDISSFCGCIFSAPPGTLSVSFAKAVLVVFHRDLLN